MLKKLLEYQNSVKVYLLVPVQNKNWPGELGGVEVVLEKTKIIKPAEISTPTSKKRTIFATFQYTDTFYTLLPL